MLNKKITMSLQFQRETLVKLVCIEREDSFCYAAVSRGGRVGIYSGEMRLLHTYEVWYPFSSALSLSRDSFLNMPRYQSQGAHWVGLPQWSYLTWVRILQLSLILSIDLHYINFCWILRIVSTLVFFSDVLPQIGCPRAS